MKFHVIDNVYLNPKMIEYMAICEDEGENKTTYHIEISVSRRTFAHGDYKTIDEAKEMLESITREMEKIK